MDRLTTLLVAAACMGTGCYGAYIGDGRSSLITGRQLNLNDTRGACSFDGQIYQSETSIPRPDPCHYCVCMDGKTDCFWKHCAPPPDGCATFEIEGVCNPSLYVCSIPELLQSPPKNFQQLFQTIKRKREISSQVRIDEPFPVDLTSIFSKELEMHNRFRRAKDHPKNSCKIAGIMYQVGETVGVASDFCQECRCASQKLFCSPKCCFKPAPFFLRSKPSFRSLDGASGNYHPLHFLLKEYLA